MKIFTRIESVIRKFKWYHILLVKLSVFFFTLSLLTLWDTLADWLLGIGWQWHVGLTIIIAVPVWKKIFDYNS